MGVPPLLTAMLLLAHMNEAYVLQRACGMIKKKTMLLASTIKENQQLLSPVVPDLKGIPYKIIEVIPPEKIQSVRLRHIQLESSELANECKTLLTNGKADFSELASSLSICSYTKGKGGDLGWIDNNQALFDKVDEVPGRYIISDVINIPYELFNASLYMSKGDISVIPGRAVDSNGQEITRWHVLQVLDIMTKLTPSLFRRKKEVFKKVQTTSGLLHSTDSSSQKYSIDTMGCQMNTADSERMEAQMRELGYDKTSNSSEAHVVILNTCSIRDHAEQKVYSYVGPHALRKRNGEDVSIIVAGCVAQQEGEKIIKRFPEVDAVMGPQYANRIGDLLKSVFEGHQIIATDPAHQTEDVLPALRKSDISAFVNVIYGCNERCTYCVVPNTRGIEQSRSKDAIIAEVEDLVANGYKEITLLGQNIDSWGRDFNPKQKFAELLAAVGQVPDIKRVRFLTSHPK